MHTRAAIVIAVAALLVPHPGVATRQAPPFAYSITAVDRKPVPLDLPALSRAFTAAGERGALSFVVDWRGWVDLGTVHLSSPPGPGALEAARRQLAGLRFRPAERKGQAVRARVALRAVEDESSDAPYQARDFDAYEVFDLEVLPRVANQGDIRALMEELHPRSPEARGAVMAQFVVLPDGRVDAGTITIMWAERDALAAPTAAVVARLRFRPGMRRGSAVRVLTALPLSWPPGR